MGLLGPGGGGGVGRCVAAYGAVHGHGALGDEEHLLRARAEPADRVGGQVDLRPQRHAEEREDLARAALEGGHPPYHLAVHAQRDAAAQRLGQPREEAVAVEVVVPVPDVVEVRVDEPLVVDGQPQVAHGLQGELLPLAVLRDARARLRDHVRHVGVHERDDLRRHGPSHPEAR